VALYVGNVIKISEENRYLFFVLCFLEAFGYSAIALTSPLTKYLAPGVEESMRVIENKWANHYTAYRVKKNVKDERYYKGKKPKDYLSA
jgi:hypothetical protein